MFDRALQVLQRLFLMHYQPEPNERGFLERAETQNRSGVEVTVAIPDARESERLFGVPLARRGLQPVHIRVVNRSSETLRLHFRSIDPHYFPPLEAAARCHFSILKRLSAFGVLVWFYIFFVLVLAPIKLLSVRWANQKMDTWFQSLGFHRRPIAPGGVSEGFVFTSIDIGTKLIRVQLMATGGKDSAGQDSVAMEVDAAERMSGKKLSVPFVDMNFTVSVAGIDTDYLHRKIDKFIPGKQLPDCDVRSLIERLRDVSTVACNHLGEGSGDPINLVVIGDFEMLLTAFSGRWDETEVISLATCWKTLQAFTLGSEYRYSPVSSLFLFGRSQDIALQQIRKSISERLHLRLWMAEFTFQKKPVWVGQVSRDIGVRFTTSAWNLTTHRIDPDVDESRDYVLEDLLDAERVAAAGYVDAAAACTQRSPRRNLTGDPYFTDGKRVVIQLGDHQTPPYFIAWS